MSTRCQHKLRVELRWKRGMTGEIVAALQCGKCCRQIGRPIELEKLTEAVQIALRPWQKPHAGSRRKKKSDREFEERYKRPDWRGEGGKSGPFLKRILERDGFECQGENCDEPAVTGHHTSYEHLGEGGDLEAATVLASCNRCNFNEYLWRRSTGLMARAS